MGTDPLAHRPPMTCPKCGARDYRKALGDSFHCYTCQYHGTPYDADPAEWAVLRMNADKAVIEADAARARAQAAAEEKADAMRREIDAIRAEKLHRERDEIEASLCGRTIVGIVCVENDGITLALSDGKEARFKACCCMGVAVK